MGRAALIESLRSRAVEDVDALWRDTRASAESHRRELTGVLEQQRAAGALAAATLSRKLEDDASAEARRRAREVRAEAMLALAGRLRSLASAELPRLRSEGGERLFAALAAELPRRDWDRVRVNPADRDLASACVPGAAVECDESICGGLEVEAEGGRIRISNTLETRLDTAWPDMLPGLIAGLLPESRDDRTAA
jgi:vacuolar-type H+-ATPase subunit E/Vma4